MFSPKAMIHLDNLAYNYRLIKKQLNNVPIMAVVKANAYGHGVIEVSRTLRDEGVKFFAVFIGRNFFIQHARTNYHT